MLAGLAWAGFYLHQTDKTPACCLRREYRVPSLDHVAVCEALRCFQTEDVLRRSETSNCAGALGA